MLSPELQYLSPFWKRWEGGRWTALEKKRSRSSDTRFDVVGMEARSTALWVLFGYDYIFIKTLNVHIWAWCWEEEKGRSGGTAR